MNKLITIVIAFAAYLISASAVSADYGCAPYGGECPTASSVVVDKQIKDPRTKGDVYVDNLLLSDYVYSPGEDIIFKITIKNTGTTAVDDVHVYDAVPQTANYVLLSGDPRESIRELTRDLGTLQADETKTWFIRMRVKPAGHLPEGTVCGDPQAINRVRVSAENMPDTHDTSSYCVQDTVNGISQQPEAGSEIIYIAAGLMALAGIGFAGQVVLARS